MAILWRVLLILGLLGLVSAELCQAPPPPPPPETFRGKVLLLSDILKQAGIEIDPDAPRVLALQAEDGKVYPLLMDAGGRTFYRDTRLLNRPMQLRGLVFRESRLLQVLEIYSLKENRPHEVYYWCEVCAIKRFSLEKTGVCECCGGTMELREVELKR